MKNAQDYILVGYPILKNSYQAGVLPAVIFPYLSFYQFVICLNLRVLEE